MVTNMQPWRRYLRLIGGLVVVLCVVAGIWRALAPEPAGVSISPRNVYRLEYYDVSPLLRLLRYRDMKFPSFVRLYRINPETLLGESRVVDLWLNGDLYWYLDPPINAIQVGNDIVFENVPPECTDCPRLTDAQVMP
ncbi:hypothetical protein [Paracidovorax sp. MALMAid1276]|uniref:hypothetical protein n=1 Tax=Paracidovorax sp. MALMAid1276 TaxID=3411631 RepID=UPI003B9DB7AC